MMRKIRLLLAAMLMLALPAAAGAAPEERALPAHEAAHVVQQRLGLELDGKFAGWLDGAEWGLPSAQVDIEPAESGQLRKKHIAGVKYEDITVTLSTGMDKAMYEWIKASFDKQASRKNGAIIAADYDYKEISRVTFTGALITEINMPALDAASKDAAKMTIKLRPEQTGYRLGSGQTLPRQVVQKKWLPANFRLRINELEAAAPYVSQVDPIQIWRDEDGVLNVANIAFTVQNNPLYEERGTKGENPLFEAAPALNPLFAWSDEVLLGARADVERSGVIQYLGGEKGDEVLFELHFGGAGLFKLTPDKVEAGSEQIRRIKAEMYCEDMRFDYAPAAAQ